MTRGSDTVSAPEAPSPRDNAGGETTTTVCKDCRGRGRVFDGQDDARCPACAPADVRRVLLARPVYSFKPHSGIEGSWVGTLAGVPFRLYFNSLTGGVHYDIEVNGSSVEHGQHRYGGLTYSRGHAIRVVRSAVADLAAARAAEVAPCSG